jgi:drug/metabolite transporter (DMT)-like permease
MNNKKLHGLTYLIIALLSHSLYGVFSRIIGIGFGQVFQVVARSAILLAFFLVLICIQGKWKKIEKKNYKWYLFMIIPGLIALISMFTAFNKLPLGTVLFTYYAVSTLGGYILGFMLYREKINRIKFISLLLSFFGLYLIFFNSIRPGNITYLLLACLAGLGAAAWNTVSKKISNKYSTVQILFMDSLLLVLFGLPISFFLHEPITFPSFTLPWLGIVGYAIAAIGSSIFTIKGFKYLQAQTGSLIMLLEPVFGAIIGLLVYKEIIGLYTAIGAFLILIGAALPNLRKS